MKASAAIKVLTAALGEPVGEFEVEWGAICVWVAIVAFY